MIVADLGGQCGRGEYQQCADAKCQNTTIYMAMDDAGTPGWVKLWKTKAAHGMFLSRSVESLSADLTGRTRTATARGCGYAFSHTKSAHNRCQSGTEATVRQIWRYEQNLFRHLFLQDLQRHSFIFQSAPLRDSDSRKARNPAVMRLPSQEDRPIISC